MIFKYGSRVARMTGNVRKYIYEHTKNYRRISLPLPDFASFLTEFFPYPAAFFISNAYAGFLLFKKKTASESPFLETRTFRLHRNRRIASGDSDVFRTAPAVCIINTVRLPRTLLRDGSPVFLKRLRNVPPFFSSKLPQQVSHLSCAVFPSTRMVFLQQQFSALCIHPVYTTIQFCHDFSSCFLTFITESLLRHPAVKLFSDTLFNVSWFSLLFTHV